MNARAYVICVLLLDVHYRDEKNNGSPRRNWRRNDIFFRVISRRRADSRNDVDVCVCVCVWMNGSVRFAVRVRDFL